MFWKVRGHKHPYKVWNRPLVLLLYNLDQKLKKYEVKCKYYQNMCNISMKIQWCFFSETYVVRICSIYGFIASFKQKYISLDTFPCMRNHCTRMHAADTTTIPNGRQMAVVMCKQSIATIMWLFQWSWYGYCLQLSIISFGVVLDVRWLSYHISSNITRAIRIWTCSDFRKIYSEE